MNRMPSSQVLELYDEVDRLTDAFKGALGLHCPPGCGDCCKSTKVETTVLELLPLAKELWQCGQAEQWLDRIALSQSPTCVFYSPDEMVHGQGRCRIYPQRPLICRLFGHAAVRMKSGRLEMTICSFMRQMIEGIKEKADQLANSGFSAAVYTDVTMRLTGIDPHWGTKQLPINRAARLAIEKAGFVYSMEQGPGSTLNPDGDNGRRDRPPRRVA